MSGEYPEKRNELIALWDEYVEMNGVIIGDRSPFEQLKKRLPTGVPEYDNYPPVRGLEAIPYEMLLKLMAGEKEDK